MKQLTREGFTKWELVELIEANFHRIKKVETQNIPDSEAKQVYLSKLWKLHQKLRNYSDNINLQ